MALVNLFRIRLYKKLAGAPDGSEWSNEYEIELGAATNVTAPELADAVAHLTTFEKSIHTFSVQFKRAVISTLQSDDPIPQEASKTIGLNGIGGIAGNGNNNKVLDLSKVLVINFNGVTGRAARHQYRGALDDQSTILSAGSFTLSGVNTPTFEGAITTLANSATGPLLRIVEQGPNDVLRVRNVSSLSLGGVGGRQIKSRRRPRISLDQDAVNSRLRAALKELTLISASLQTQRAIGKLDPAKADATAALIIQYQEVTGTLSAA